MVIETKRLILRPFLEDDAADAYEYLKEQQGYDAVLKLMEEYMDKYCIL